MTNLQAKQTFKKLTSISKLENESLIWNLCLLDGILWSKKFKSSYTEIKTEVILLCLLLYRPKMWLKCGWNVVQAYNLYNPKTNRYHSTLQSYEHMYYSLLELVINKEVKALLLMIKTVIIFKADIYIYTYIYIYIYNQREGRYTIMILNPEDNLYLRETVYNRITLMKLNVKKEKSCSNADMKQNY